MYIKYTKMSFIFPFPLGAQWFKISQPLGGGEDAKEGGGGVQMGEEGKMMKCMNQNVASVG